MMDRAESGLGTQHHVLALHAFGLDGHSFDALRAELGGTCELTTLDHFGHGSLAARPSADLKEYIGAAIAAIDNHRAPWLHLVGHSFGGVVAAHAAAARCLRVASLSLLATPASGGPLFISRAQDARRIDTDKRVEATMLRWFNGDLATRHASLANSVRSTLRRQTPNAAASTWEALAQFETFDAIGSLPPTLCVASQDDQSTPPAVMQRIVDAVGAKLVVLPQGGHLFPLTESRLTANCLLDHWATTLAVACRKRGAE